MARYGGVCGLPVGAAIAGDRRRVCRRRRSEVLGLPKTRCSAQMTDCWRSRGRLPQPWIQDVVSDCQCQPLTDLPESRPHSHKHVTLASYLGLCSRTYFGLACSPLELQQTINRGVELHGSATDRPGIKCNSPKAARASIVDTLS